MPELIGGLPLHPLVVHFVVVSLVAASLGAVLTAVWPAVRRRFGWLVVGVSVVATALVPVATTSGKNLEEGLGGSNPLIARHEELADLMLWWALGLTVAVAALMFLHTSTERRAKVTGPAEGEGGGTAVATRSTTGQTVAMVAAMVLTVGLGVGTGIHIYRVGDAGARTVWQDVGENLQ